MATITARVDDAQTGQTVKSFFESIGLKYEVAYPEDDICLTFPMKEALDGVKTAFSAILRHEME